MYFIDNNGKLVDTGKHARSDTPQEAR